MNTEANEQPTNAIESSTLLDVGDTIEFKAFGRTIRGPIVEVSKRGYWVKDPVPFAGKIGDTRCPFRKARLIKTSND